MLPQVEVTKNFEKSLCFLCEDLMEAPKNRSPRGVFYTICGVKCENTSGYPIPRLKCEFKKGRMV